MTKTCKTCDTEFDGPDDSPIYFFALHCAKCVADQLAAAAQEEAVRRCHEQEKRWRGLCPPSYRETIIENLPNPGKAAEVLSWAYGAVGLLLHGPTGRGKSRCAWLLARKIFDDGKTISVLDAMAGFKYAASFANGGRAANEWTQAHCRSGLLLFDDAFKAKLTDSFESAVFAIVDYRLSHKLPILAALNDNATTLAARMSVDRGDAFVRRLRDMCRAIQF